MKTEVIIHRSGQPYVTLEHLDLGTWFISSQDGRMYRKDSKVGWVSNNDYLCVPVDTPVHISFPASALVIPVRKLTIAVET